MAARMRMLSSPHIQLGMKTDRIRMDMSDITGVFSFPFHQNFLVFDPSFCRIELNTIQLFLVKRYHSSFWILASKGKKKAKKAKKPSHTP
jgi:hypothetical protein